MATEHQTASSSGPSGSTHRTEAAIGIMDRYAERTGVASNQDGKRYLWTDAFAVMNDLALGEITGEERFRGRARTLVDKVHHALGRHRDDDARSGPISGLSEEEAEAHPTMGGLRIGKPMPERRPGERLDPRAEWERDGQYFHYLTKWMQALDRGARSLREPRLSTWACELAGAAFHAFVGRTQTATTPRMVWKMSIDLSRILVPSMGQHDPLDGLVTFRQLEKTRSQLHADATSPAAKEAAFAEMVDFEALGTADPLGIGGLLLDAAHLEQIRSADDFGARRLMEALVTAASDGIDAFLQQGDLRERAEHRLAFRELGLAIGLAALETIEDSLARRAHDARDAVLRDLVDPLVPFANLGRSIESFWREPANRRSDTWRAHEDINEVMLAASLVPHGVTIIPPLTA
jgi:hypothetical protein